MRSPFAVSTTVLLAACASFGGQPQFTGSGPGTVASGVACLTDEIEDDGWTITTANEAGMIRAENGAHWIEANVLEDESITAAYVVRITTADTEPARELGSELAANCST